jgi:subtilase family serine protease
MEDSPEELMAEYPLDQWITYNNFAANAQWRTGATYIKKRGTRIGDTVLAVDCETLSNYSTFNASPDNSPAPIPCLYGASLDNSVFPITLAMTSGKPEETDFQDDGIETSFQGVTMWIANEPINANPFTRYRVFFELNGNVYMGILQPNGTVFDFGQTDGSLVRYQITLNQAAADSIKQGAITAAVTSGSEMGSSNEVRRTVDWFGIGGHGLNGSLAPADLRTHYNIPQSLTGAGQTIAIVDGPGVGDVLGDLNVFSQYYNLPQSNAANPCFQHLYGPGASASESGNWGDEVALDTQMVHGIAPAATIVLVTAASGSFDDLMNAVNYAAALPGVTAVSMSFNILPLTSSQVTTEDDALSDFQLNPGIIFFASSGDFGDLEPNTYPSYPASSPYVTAVGGTTILSVPWIRGTDSETAWEYSGGGASPYASMPIWQSSFLPPSVVSANVGQRAFPDVAAAADWTRSPLGIYWKDQWGMYGGTSMATPLWAGVSALFGEYLISKGSSMATLIAATPGGFNGLIYQMKLMQGSSDGFFAILSGSNDINGVPCVLCTATSGYDDVTGLGVPDVSNLFLHF